MMPIASIALKTEVPRLAMRMTASRIAGKQNTMSMKRISTASTLPPNQAASRPTSVPPDAPISTATRPTTMEVRDAWITRERMSRPSSSVPRRCAALGPSSITITSSA